jgi:hypothetical protein
MGMLDGLKNFVGGLNTSQGGQPAFTDRLNTFGATLQDFDDNGGRAQALAKAQQDKLEQQQAAEQRQQIAALADSLGLSPKEKLLYMANPKAFGELLKEQQSPYTLSEGSQRFGPNGESIAAAPKTMAFGDQILQAGPQGVNPLYTRNKTYAEQLSELLGKGNLDVARQNANTSQGQLGVAQGNLGVNQGNLGLSRQRFAREGINATGNAVRVSSPQQLQSLPPGSHYIGPDGVTRVKP